MPSDVPPQFLRLAGHPVRWRLLTELAGGDHRVRELVERVDESQNLVSYHLRQLRDAGLVTTTRSTFDARDSYYHLDLDRCAQALADSGAALHPSLRPAGTGVEPRGAVLFVCTGNSFRSPVAEALLRDRTAGRVSVSSAGCAPKAELHPNTVRVLREDFGIDVSDRSPQHVDALGRRRFDRVITLCDRAREACDLTRHPRRAHWSIPEPDTSDMAAVRRTAEEIDTRVRHLLPVLATDR